MTANRRQVLKGLAAGSAAVIAPAFLAGCGVVPASRLQEPAPANPFLEWFGIDEQYLSRIMADLTVHGADLADLYFQQRRRTAITQEQGTPSEPRVQVSQGLGLRVVRNGRSGFAVTENLDLASMRAAARQAAAAAEPSAGPGPQYRVAEAGKLYLVRQSWTDTAVDLRLGVLQQVDSRLRSADARIENVILQWSDSDERVLIATQDGGAVTDRRPMTRLSVQAVAVENGRRVSGFASIAARDGIDWYSDERLDELVATVLERTVTQFGAHSPPFGDMPVILAAGSSGIVLHEGIGHALEADFAHHDQGHYAKRLGEQVAAGGVTIIDQGSIPHARGALNVDDEGTPCQRNVLIENGILRGFLHDGRTALEQGAEPGGSARRESWRYPPMPRMTCTWMADGVHSRDDIIASVDRGVIAETFFGGRVEPGGGDFSFQVGNGWLVENGRITTPLRNFRIRGNGPEMLQRVAMVGNDGEFDRGGWTCGKRGQRVPVSQGMPTTLVSSLNVAPQVQV